MNTRSEESLDTFVSSLAQLADKDSANLDSLEILTHSRDWYAVTIEGGKLTIAINVGGEIRQLERTVQLPSFFNDSLIAAFASECAVRINEFESVCERLWRGNILHIVVPPIATKPFVRIFNTKKVLENFPQTQLPK